MPSYSSIFRQVHAASSYVAYRFALSALPALLLTALFLSSSLAQNPLEADDETIRVRTDLVTVPLFVVDSSERRVSGLTQNDFTVRDNGRAASISYFAAGAERVALLFALDASGSAREIITQQQETALALFSRFGKNSRVGVLHFREQPELVLPLTTDAPQVRSAFRIPAMTNRRTAIFDAALAAVRAVSGSDNKDNRSGRPERRIVILISDGLDTRSRVQAVAAINEARLRGVSIYVVHLPLYVPRDNRLVARSPTKGFRELARQTGGQFFTVGTAETALDPRAEYDLTAVFEAITNDLQGQYVIGYYPDESTRNARGKHQIEVSLTSPNHRKLRVRTLRESYVLNDDTGVNDE